MENFTIELATDIVFPNINVYRKYRDGKLCAYEVYPAEGYVIYDTTDEDYDIDSDTLEMIPVIRYYMNVGIPVAFNFDNFTWVAVLENETNIKNPNIATEADYQEALREMGVSL